MKLKGAIFDLDGVLVNTVPLHFKAWQRMFEEYGHAFSLTEYLKKVDGRPRDDGTRAILTDLDEGEIERAGLKKQEYFQELLEKDPIEIFKSSVALAEELVEAGIKTAVASSSKNTVAILERTGLAGLFVAVITGNDFKKGKPDPEIFLLAARQLGVKPKECVVFEDAKAGVEAARSGGFFGVGIDRHNDPGDLAAADVVVADLSEITLQDIISKMEHR